VQAETVTRLSAFFRRNGYVRFQNARRLKAEGYRVYKKGDEVRLVVETSAELKTIRRLLQQAGFKPGRPFTKSRKRVQPVYGREAVARFLILVGESSN
jgi:hypothetical protein